MRHCKLLVVRVTVSVTREVEPGFIRKPFDVECAGANCEARLLGQSSPRFSGTPLQTGAHNRNRSLGNPPKNLLSRIFVRIHIVDSVGTLHPRNIFLYSIFQRLRWSRGSVLVFSTQVRGFKPDRSRRIFKGEKILSTPSFGGEVKPSVPCRRFTACKRSLNGVEVVISAKLPDIILAHRSHFRRWGLSRRGGR